MRKDFYFLNCSNRTIERFFLSWVNSGGVGVFVLFQDALVLPPAAAPVAALNTPARSFLTTQVRILNRYSPLLATRGPKTNGRSLQGFQGKIPVTGGLHFSSPNRTSRACRMDPTSKSKCADRRVHVLWVYFFIFLFLELSLFSPCCRNGTYTVANGQVTCIAREMVLKRQLSETSDGGKPEQHQTTPTTPSS